jgi:hypothetical protein
MEVVAGEGIESPTPVMVAFREEGKSPESISKKSFSPPDTNISEKQRFPGNLTGFPTSFT